MHVGGRYVDCRRSSRYIVEGEWQIAKRRGNYRSEEKERKGHDCDKTTAEEWRIEKEE